MLVSLGVFESLALAGRCEMSCPFGVLGTPVIGLALDSFGLVFVSVCRWDLHPFWAILLLFLALFGPVFVFPFLLLLLRLLLLLTQLLDLRFQSENLLFFRGRGVPSLCLLLVLNLLSARSMSESGLISAPSLYSSSFLWM